MPLKLKLAALTASNALTLPDELKSVPFTLAAFTVPVTFNVERTLPVKLKLAPLNESNALTLPDELKSVPFTLAAFIFAAVVVPDMLNAVSTPTVVKLE